VSQAAIPVYASLAVFSLTYAAISLVRPHRIVIAISGATMMIIVGTSLSFYGLPDVIHAIDFDAIALLLGMMIIANMFGKTGLFQYAAIKGAKLARGNLPLLLVYLGASVFLLSMILDNMTAILISLPVTVSLTDILGISPLPFIVGEVILAQIGGMATLIGSPGNIIIGSAAGFSFRSFLTHIAPIAIIAAGGGMGLLFYLFRRELRGRPANVNRLLGMDERGAITDRKKARRVLLVLGGIILLFLFHDAIKLTPGIVAMIGAAGALLALRPDFDTTLKEIRWDTLLFFISLFIVAGGLNASGGFSPLTRGLAGLSEGGLYTVALSLLWGSALLSSVVGTVPFAIAVLPVFTGLSSSLPSVSPLFWALAIGASAGAAILPTRGKRGAAFLPLFRSLDVPIPTGRWIKSTVPVALGICAAGSLALILRLL